MVYSKQLIIGDNLKNNEYEELLIEIIDARTIIDKYVKDLDDNDKFFFIEFKDPFNNFINKI